MKMMKSPLGAVGTVRSFMNVVKDIDFEEVRNRAEQQPKMLVLTANEERGTEAATALFGEADRGVATVETWGERDTFDPSLYDVVIVFDPDGQGLFDKVRKATGSRRASTNVFFLAKHAESAAAADAVRQEVMEMFPDLAPAFGRHFKAWRPAAVKAIIDQNAKANAQFALVSNIPAVVPVLGGLMSASADLLVLTKNQLMMCYKIAAAHDRELGNHMAVVRELTPVVGAGFLWRTAAREAASFIPLAAGTIPKVGIAYAGTMTMGKAADYFYRHGNKPDAGQFAQFRKQAEDMLAKLPIIGDEANKDVANRKDGDKAITDGEFRDKS